MEGLARIGCSGWEYKHWAGVFYPSGVPRSQWLEHYASRFDTVEINNSFYRLPGEETAARWATRVPPSFVFAWKASRYLTHMKKLATPEEALDRMMASASRLGASLGPILYQTPPGWSCAPDRLAAFIQKLPDTGLHAFEFRNPSWYCDQVFELLDTPRTTLCLHDMPGSETTRVSVGGFVYVRFHGADARYSGGYPGQTLESWARWLAEERRQHKRAFVYFNNDVGGHAPEDALRLRDYHQLELARQWLEQGAVLLDVRTPGEFEQGHARGARNVPVQELTERVDEIPRGTRVVLYCHSGIRSSSAAAFLTQEGYEVIDLGRLDRAMQLSALQRPEDRG